MKTFHEVLMTVER